MIINNIRKCTYKIDSSLLDRLLDEFDHDSFILLYDGLNINRLDGWARELDNVKFFDINR